MSGIALVISDVDGTLVTTQKHLTERSRAAVALLRRNGIGFTLVSSRPSFGLRMLIDPLGLALPLAAFNGGLLVTPALEPLEQHLIGAAPALAAIELFDACGVDVWLFTADAWLVRDPRGAYVDCEIETVQVPPTVVASFAPHLAAAIKVVGVSLDFDKLSACEATARPALGGRATVARSQLYYLDVTASGTDKGVAVETLMRRIHIAPSQLVTLGDMENDVPMFRKAGFSIAMGNASDAVKGAASAVTLANDEDGFAAAVERLILPRAGRAAGDAR